ncbi:MAG: PIN domain-containing protein [Fibromonadaceae bacterium]|jgi:predicted nucleic acid-binding protein|nr:PIN domain-containing protein [Fibromonadaceae bacterium]
MKSMRDKVFLDTNIFVYAYTSNDKDKHNAVLELFVKLKATDLHLCISSQVLNEFYAVETIKYKVEHSEVVDYIKAMSKNFSVFGITRDTSLYALSLKEKYHYSWWDSLVLASALENGCQIVYSEDMQHKQIIENSLKIINPFLK